jgi:fluoride ion exporter CrcB/FEX
MTLTSIFIVSLGGALGTFLRYALSTSLGLYGITIVNLIGCFAIGHYFLFYL